MISGPKSKTLPLQNRAKMQPLRCDLNFARGSSCVDFSESGKARILRSPGSRLGATLPDERLRSHDEAPTTGMQDRSRRARAGFAGTRGALARARGAGLSNQQDALAEWLISWNLMCSVPKEKPSNRHSIGPGSPY